MAPARRESVYDCMYKSTKGLCTWLYLNLYLFLTLFLIITKFAVKVNLLNATKFVVVAKPPPPLGRPSRPLTGDGTACPSGQGSGPTGGRLSHTA